MIAQIFFGLLRHLLTTGGGALVTEGYLTQDQMFTAVGALMTLSGIGWSVWHHKKPPTSNQAPNPLPAVESAPEDTADDLNRAEALLLRQRERQERHD